MSIDADTSVDRLLQQLTDQLSQEDNDDLIRCAHCDTPITKASARTSIDGQHLFQLNNPVGLVFTVACFSQAPGCLIHGEATDDYSWFPPYQWQYCYCEYCHDHLGWYYQYLAHGFFGLIADKLVR